MLEGLTKVPTVKEQATQWVLRALPTQSVNSVETCKKVKESEEKRERKRKKKTRNK
jgi:hypothetical protein